MKSRRNVPESPRWKKIPAGSETIWPDPDEDDRRLDELILEKRFVGCLLETAMSAPQNFSESELQAMRNQIQLKERAIEILMCFIELRND